MLTYAAPISAYDLLNSIIVRLDVIMLGCFVGRAPGVTLITLGIYAAAVEVASGLRKINQAFNPIFAPVMKTRFISDQNPGPMRSPVMQPRSSVNDQERNGTDNLAGRAVDHHPANDCGDSRNHCC